MRIFLNDIQVHAHHGVMEQEATVGGDFLVSVSMEADVERAGETDCLEDTVNYADIALLVKQEMAIRSKLLEHVATRIAKRLLAEFSAARSVKVSITKLCPPIPGLQSSGAGVELTLRNL
ncbi:MAG: dihydroneopterin aldolase [Bacteroidaceae bacterium]|nr:dihydroneopterin aldolase [Bacteroidaceae bacterium]